MPLPRSVSSSLGGRERTSARAGDKGDKGTRGQGDKGDKEDRGQGDKEDRGTRENNYQQMTIINFPKKFSASIHLICYGDMDIW
ncbi:MAG: hypothetical protein CLLPBCKN_004041 [Chroococcidiopsis cubana SAG 39.79]|nr:hypothetical protein [Chroococcidiopsis cubana SAG 39.79]